MTGRFLASVVLAALSLSARPGAAQLEKLPTWQLSRDLMISASKEGLDRPYSLVVTRSGTIVVGDNANLTISTYDSTGRRLARGGGKGRGPGELQMFNETAHGTTGDSVWFYDPSQMRIVVYSSQGKHVRTMTVPERAKIAGASPPSGLRIYPRALLSGGSTIVTATNDIDPRLDTSSMNTIHVGMLSPSGLEARIVASLSSPKTSIAGVNGTTWSWIVVPFVYSPQPVVSTDGAFVLLIAAANGKDRVDTVSVTAIRSTGETVYALKKVLPRMKVADSSFNKARDSQLATARRYGTESQVRDKLTKAMPRSYPAVARAFITREGRAWLEMHPDGCAGGWTCKGPATFLVISPAGRPEALVAVPASVSLTDGFGDHVWGFDEDEDGFRNIVRFRIRR